MKKIYSIALIYLGFTSINYAQNQWCGAHDRMETVFDQNPGLEEQMYRQLADKFSQETPIMDRDVNGTIPVVVHIIHDGSESNISYDQILDAITILNEDYQKLNADTIDTRNTTDAPFSPIAANIGLTFELAKLDPNGECTNGVQRIYAPHLTDNAGDNVKSSANGGADPWPYDKYLNIWVVNSIESSGGAGITLGYAQFPYDYPPIYVVDPSIHGIVIRHDSFGTIGTSNTNGETLTHEVGHILGLFHTFEDIFDFSGDGCHTEDCTQNGDFICDTPPCSAATWGCNTSQNSCTDIPSGDFYGIDAYDQFENWMSYDNCQNMFTEGQKTRILTNLTDIAFLANWISPANNTATGVGMPETLCKAEFFSDKTIICAGESVQFYDQSYFNVTGTNWTLTGGTPANSTNADPLITYNTPGLYPVTLEATDGSSTVTNTVTDYILVLPNPGDPSPYHEGFQSMTNITDNNRFMTINQNGGETWEHNDQIGSTGSISSKSAWINNYGNADGTTDELVSGTIDLSSVPGSETLVFSFKFAYKKKESSTDEWLRLYVSNDCGETWVLRKSLHGSALSQDILSTPYTEPQVEDWTLVSLTNITSGYYTADFRYKFEFTNDDGNNIFIDDINIYPESMTELMEFDGLGSLSVYPNPVNNNLTIELFASSTQNFSIDIYSAIGQKIASIYEGQLNKGLNTLNYSTEQLPRGVYFVRVSSEGRLQTIKLIKE